MGRSTRHKEEIRASRSKKNHLLPFIVKILDRLASICSTKWDETIITSEATANPSVNLTRELCVFIVLLLCWIPARSCGCSRRRSGIRARFQLRRCLWLRLTHTVFHAACFLVIVVELSLHTILLGVVKPRHGV